MYAKFTFYSAARQYAVYLGLPASIVLGLDNLYWVVDSGQIPMFVNQGCTVIE